MNATLSFFSHRILNRQEVLNTATSEAKQRREAVKRYKMKEQTYFAHRLERERLAMQVKMLQQQLQEQELTEENGEGNKKHSFCYLLGVILTNTLLRLQRGKH